MPSPAQVEQAIRRQGVEQEAPRPVLPCEATKTWIEVKLLDAEGNPVAKRKYVVKAPGGRVEQGTLDANGRARVEGLEPGTCLVSFPELDGNAWERV